jgi:hypothetical protein
MIQRGVERRSPHIFCLVPPDRADDLLAPLRRHFAGDRTLEVIVERRREEGPPRFLAPAEQRHRRAPVAERDLAGSLPARLRGEAGVLRFQQRLRPLGGVHQATATDDLAVAVRAGDPDAASELWWRCHERVRMRLRARLGDVEAAGAERALLGRILDALSTYEAEPGRPFTAWLDDVVDRFAAERLAA